MEVLNLRSNSLYPFDGGLPIAVYTVGAEVQPPISRLEGYSSPQLLLTFSGTGKFRRLGQEKWDILKQGSLLYIPARLPNEYMPVGDDPWFVGYVSYFEGKQGLLESWGFGDEPFTCVVGDVHVFLPYIKKIWMKTGPEPELWETAEILLAMCLELLKQIHSCKINPQLTLSGNVHESIVEGAIRFMHDHLGRRITLGELSSSVGYSTKQLTRLFKQETQLTPMQYLQGFRLRTAQLLLMEYPKLTIRQVAAIVGLEPEYFTRLYRRYYGRAPSLSRGKGMS